MRSAGNSGKEKMIPRLATQRAGSCCICQGGEKRDHGKRRLLPLGKRNNWKGRSIRRKPGMTLKKSTLLLRKTNRHKRQKKPGRGERYPREKGGYPNPRCGKDCARERKIWDLGNVSASRQWFLTVGGRGFYSKGGRGIVLTHE